MGWALRLPLTHAKAASRNAVSRDCWQWPVAWPGTFKTTLITQYTLLIVINCCTDIIIAISRDYSPHTYFTIHCCYFTNIVRAPPSPSTSLLCCSVPIRILLPIVILIQNQFFGMLAGSSYRPICERLHEALASDDVEPQERLKRYRGNRGNGALRDTCMSSIFTVFFIVQTSFAAVPFSYFTISNFTITITRFCHLPQLTLSYSMQFSRLVWSAKPLDHLILRCKTQKSYVRCINTMRFVSHFQWI